MGKNLHELLLPLGIRRAKTAPSPHTKDTELAAHKKNQLQLRRKDGREVEIECTLNAVELEDGRHTIGIIRDVTERTHAEEALRESEKNISNFLNSIDASVTSYSIKNSRFIYVSPSTEHVYGRTIEECIRNKFAAIDYVHPDDLDILHDITTQMTQHGSAEGECRIIKPDGSIAWVHALVKLIRDENGEPDRIDRVITDITERKNLELQLLKTKEDQENILNQIDDIVMCGSIKDNSFSYLSPSFATLFGSNIEAHLNDWHLWTEYVHPDDHEILFNTVMTRTVEDVSEQEFRIIKPNGDIAWVRARSKIITDANGEPDRIQRILTDITKYKKAEQAQEKLQAQLLQSQKMESVGRLAGGVAHDFNNMLSVIIGHADLALRCLAPGQPLHKTFTQICKTAERAGVLTRELLAFAGKQTIAPEVLDVNESIEGMLTMLRRLIGDHINLVWQPGDNLDPVKVDPSQINHILAEVCLNAKDAVNDGGTITITTGSASINEFLCAQQPSLVPGEYITLSISDDGQGMDSETLANIFEPFFSRKELGKGLGMATVYGIVEQNNGFINISSEPGIGTCVTVYLPQHSSPKPLSLVTAGKAETPAEGTKTILLVEDEPENLEMYRTMLASLGYNVLAAGTPQDCLSLAQSYKGHIDLLITDVVMPEMNGRELADAFIASHPTTQCLFMSGYSAEVISRNGMLASGINFIEKPFTLENFAKKIDGVLNDSHNYSSATLKLLNSGLPKPHKATH
jgi:PAS domain S-box-containing protein